MFSTCGNDGCQRSCTRLDTTGCSPLCTLSGCVCVPGFVRNDAGICVLPATCRKYIYVITDLIHLFFHQWKQNNYF